MYCTIIGGKGWAIHWVPNIEIASTGDGIDICFEAGYEVIDEGITVAYINYPSLLVYANAKNEGGIMPIRPVVELKGNIPQ